MNRQRNNQRQIRRKGRQPGTVATRNNVITTRIFRGTDRIDLQSANSALGGVESFFNCTAGIGAYTGSNYISQNHEQYRVVNVKIMAKPSIGLCPAPSSTQDAIRFQNIIYGICNQTEIQSFVDYDTASSPTTYDQVVRRPNLKIRGLVGDKWTLIGDFSPKAISNPSGGTGASRVFDTNEWMTTQNLDTTLHGLRGYASCRSPAFTISDETAYPAIDLIYVATVQMRGNKNEDSSALGMSTMIRQYESEEEEDEQEEVIATKATLPPIGKPKRK